VASDLGHQMKALMC